MLPKLYSALAEWWPLLSAPEEYEEEAAIYAAHIAGAGDDPARTVLELGSGGGNNASYLKRSFEMTLVDLSPGMLAHSRKLNPDCDHHEGDMRAIRLDRKFDRVFVHDAVCYMATIDDLRRAIETAFWHCRPGGGAVFVPDYVRETFVPGTDCGGHDGPRRSLRYLEWVWDPDPTDNNYIVDMAYVLREANGSVRVEHDRHVEGLFSRDEWMQLLSHAGFEPRIAVVTFSDFPRPIDLFIGTRPMPDELGSAAAK